jgi:hypothetical protein
MPQSTSLVVTSARLTVETAASANTDLTSSPPGSAMRSAISAELSSATLLTRGFGATLGNQLINQRYAVGNLAPEFRLHPFDGGVERVHHDFAIDNTGADAVMHSDAQFDERLRRDDDPSILGDVENDRNGAGRRRMFHKDQVYRSHVALANLLGERINPTAHR